LSPAKKPLGRKRVFLGRAPFVDENLAPEGAFSPGEGIFRGENNAPPAFWLEPFGPSTQKCLPPV